MAQFPSTEFASGIWSLKKQKRAEQGDNWPATNDPYFEYVSLLLPGNGTNGAQNNTLLDSSVNAFSITRNGNTTQGSFSPYGSNWSNYFDGSGDWLETANNAAFDFGSGDFTVECYAYFNSVSTAQTFFSRWRVNQYGFIFLYDPATGLNFIYSTTGLGAGNVSRTYSTTLSAGQWYHIAFARSSGSTRAFVNGIQVGSTTSDNVTIFNSNQPQVVGITRDDSLFYPMNGYISNLRVLKGTALYTSNFTPSTAPLVAITNTSLLTCQSNRFRDASTNNFTLTRNGDVSVQRFSPFNPTEPYATGTIGGSGYFDGNADYLTAPDNVSFDFGAGDFTVEAWLYDTGGGSPVAAGLAVGDWLFENTSGRLSFGRSLTAFDLQTAVGSVNFFCWNHLAVSRSAGTLRLFINGALSASASNTISYNIATPLAIGGRNVNGSNTVDVVMNGFMTGFRIVKGSAVYTTNFTPPTTPLTAITNTQLLLNYTNAGIIDNAMMNDLETVGNAQISTSVSKFGNGSIAFDGSGDLLYLPANENFNLGTTYTIELWLYMNNPATGGIMFSISDINTGSFAELSLQVSSSAPRFVVRPTTGGAFAAVTGGTLLANTWQHIAISVNAGSGRLFLNGVQVGSTTTFSALQTRVHVGVGGYGNGFGTTLNGYIDDLRITKGYARYTANFTPPGPLPLY